DFDADTDGDPHGSDSAALSTAYFRYPCANPDGSVWYETTTGACAPAPSPGAVFKLGIARELKIVDSRGLVLDATLWIPGEALTSAACSSTACSGTGTPSLADLDSTRRFPGVVFSNGLSSRQDHYYWFAMRMARDGFLVLTYDPAGQGQSEGTWTDLFGVFDMHPACSEFSGACRDTMDAVRWFVGEPVPDERGALYVDGRIAPRVDPASNLANPASSILDVTRVAIAGNSMGAISTLNYLNAAGKDPEGNALPAVVTAISLSGATPTKATVPIQFQTSDFDGSPLLVGPTVLGVDLGEAGSGIGYNLIKQRYDQLRDDPGRVAPMELVVLEGGVHTDHVDVSVVPRTMWANSLASDYAASWLRCYAAGDAAGCAGAIVARDHLSRAFASEQVAAGSAESQCIRVPDRASLNQPPADFLSAYVDQKPVCDCFVAGTPACEVKPTFSP
ncbi:MAG TPA: alpha/beta hydrolase, partial [Candidatus Binatia bacterium]|nr:alpha/beta hydrolase [Candidatus Binatia bacterium]